MSIEYYDSKILIGQKAIDLLLLEILCCVNPDVHCNILVYTVKNLLMQYGYLCPVKMQLLPISQV